MRQEACVASDFAKAMSWHVAVRHWRDPGGMKKGRRGNVPGTLFHLDPAGGWLQIER